MSSQFSLHRLPLVFSHQSIASAMPKVSACRMGVTASDGRFEGMDGDQGRLAKFVNLGL